ncbi:MAG: FTR1 family protein, partial [Chloroflexi bacterium]|nr:FTR1 family protein [Chloroflexota bacterium]
LRNDLRPFAEGTLSYSAFDAGITLLREGLEALLVITGLLAFVKRTASRTAQTWIWGGAGLGVAASLAIAVVLQVALAQVSTGTSRELLEGITGLFAAAMLVYVSYWLHSKAGQNAWQRYVGQKAMTALARNSMLSLALIAFLAVFREGGETALFLIGMAPSIALSDLLLGLGAAAALLAVIGVALVGFGMKIPIRPFFLGTSLLLYYLAFKFVGASIHALQVASVASATPAPIPPFELVGLYPTWETTLPQIALLAAAGAVLVISRFLPRQASVTQA